MKLLHLLVSGMLLCLPLQGIAQKYRTDTFSDLVKTLQVKANGEWNALPVIQLGSDEWIEINFDLLGADPDRLTYSLIHCDADWRQSQLIESEYMEGFQNRLVEDYAPSFNTTMDYVNYNLVLPNDDINMTVSGNYVVRVFSEFDASFPVLTACFSVMEPQVTIHATPTTLTDKGMNNRYQAVNFEILYGREVRNPMQELKVFVRQNNRSDNEAALVKPLTMGHEKLVYKHTPSLIFDAGNEYRVFEMTTKRFNGLNIETMEYHPPYYHAILRPDRPRLHAYSFMEDINGLYLVRTIDSDDPNTEADYRFVHFFFPAETPFKEDLYILGDFFQNIPDERSRMEYNEIDRGYVKTTLLKEGYYNYIYLTQDQAKKLSSTAQTEGNYFQTENTYQIYVYSRPMGGRYDRLIGYLNTQYK